MRKLYTSLLLVSGGFLISYGVSSGEVYPSLSMGDSKALKPAQTCTATIRSGNPADIQNALNSASRNGRDDTICIEGTYNLNATLTYKLPAGSKECGKGLTLRAVGDGAILDGRNNYRILIIDTYACGKKAPAGKIVIEGIKFQNGRASKGAGGLFVSTNKDSVKLTDSIFIANRNFTKGGYNGGGAAISSWYGSIILANNTFSGNNAGESHGGGAFVRSVYGSVTITNNTFDGNSAYNSGGLDVYSDSGSVRLINNIFSNNTVRWYYGGASVVSYSNSVVLINNTFIGNTARIYGGGASVYSKHGSIMLINNVFSSNKTYESISAGGGVFIDSASISIKVVNNTIINNSAGYHGGGIYVELRGKATFHFYNNILWKNAVKERDGNGGGDDLYVYYEDLENERAAQVNIAHNLFTTTQQPIDFSTAPQTEKVFIEAIEKYNQSIANGCTKSGNYGNIQADPKFVDPQKGDFRLQQGSPAIDAGCNNAPGLPQTDKDGKQRIRNNTVDMGAYEFGR